METMPSRCSSAWHRQTSKVGTLMQGGSAKTGAIVGEQNLPVHAHFPASKCRLVSLFGWVTRGGGEAAESAHRIAHHLLYTPSRIAITESRHESVEATERQFVVDPHPSRLLKKSVARRMWT